MQNMPNLTKSRIFNRPKKISSTINIKQAGNNRCRSLLAVGTSQKNQTCKSTRVPLPPQHENQGTGMRRFARDNECRSQRTA